jgi:alkyl hydroperoxide reductase subunit AhpC
LAEYRDHYDELKAAGADVAALAVDGPERSEALRQKYQLPFPILCDTRREVVRAWDLLNREEKGGIAWPAVFVLGSGLWVLFASRDAEVTRVRAKDMLRFLRAGSVLGGAAALPDQAPRKRVIFPTLGEWLRTAWPFLRLSLFPRKK